jgi:hypothetical protein
MRLRPDSREKIFRDEFARSSSHGEKGIVEFARWMVAIDESEQLLKYLPDESLVKVQSLPPELLLAKLMAHARLGQWQHVRGLLKPGQEKQLGTSRYHLWLARLHAQDPGGADLVRQHLQIVAGSSGNGNETSLMLEASAVAVAIQDWPLAAQLCVAAARHAPTDISRTALLEQALQHHSSALDCGAMMATAREIAQLTPGNRSHAFRADYLALLAGESFEIVFTREPIAGADDELQARARLLQAFAAFRLGMPVLRELLVHDIPRAASWAPGHRAVFAAMLAVSGQSAAAFRAGEDIRPSLLLPEEKRLLRLAR